MNDKAKKGIGIAGLILTVFDLLMFFSLRPCWSGISKTLGYTNGANELLYYLPVYICIFFAVIALSDLLFVIFSKKWKIWPIVYFVLGLLFLGVIAAIVILGARDYLRFVWPYLFKALGITAAIGLLAWLLFAYPGKKLAEKKAFRCVCLFLAILAAGLYLTGFSLNGISCDPVVYAVEDEYQIVFSSSADSLGWVSIGGEEYYDLYSGSQKSGKIHKVCVPMYVLDEAGSYDIHVQKVIYRGPFGGFLGKVISKTVAFHAPDFSDGVQYLNLSDIHMNKKAAVRTAENAGGFDFLVLVGDMVSDVETYADANYASELASAMTGGEVPVIYARGNHEVKGAYSDDLYMFVGSKDQDFYYYVRMGELYALVLDLGEDHEDDWWEYYGTADFDSYREDQLIFIDEEIEKGAFREAGYRMAICHIPIVYVNYRHNHEYIKDEMTKRLNDMDIDMSVCGHQHEVLIFEPGLVTPGESLVYNPKYAEGTYSGYLTDFNFPNLMVSKPGYTQPESDSDRSSHIGLFVNADLKKGLQRCVYLDSKGLPVPVVNPFADKDYGSEIDIYEDGTWK
ncbi:MAG: metallophosphoesterase [Firmicutes bacterium]|nr:metallophosphoesterase [Bacillota bacterium]